jgi:hypothetical protein
MLERIVPCRMFICIHTTFKLPLAIAVDIGCILYVDVQRSMLMNNSKSEVAKE